MEKEHDPVRLGWMQGFPPAPDRIIRFADGSYYGWPQLRWSFNHIDELVPTRNVWRGPERAGPLPHDDGLFDELTIETLDGKTLTWQQMLDTTCTDGLLVLHRGTILYEQYFGACGPHTRHIIQSANKSFVGTVAECLIEEGLLDDSAPVTGLIPELEPSAWRTATIRQVMDMQVSMNFYENYQDPASDVWRFLRAMGMAPTPGGGKPETIAEVLPFIQGDGRHGEAFAYREPNIMVLGWIVRRAAGKSLATQVSERIWQHIGAEHDACYMLDASGAETTCCMTLRDFARFGELICRGGRTGTETIIPPGAMERITTGGDPAIFAKAEMPHLDGWSYRSQWWCRHFGDRMALVARGAHGQLLYVDAANRIVIARFGSSPVTPEAPLETILFPAIDAIVAATI